MGLSRSTDGGKTLGTHAPAALVWRVWRICPPLRTGVGDPSILWSTPHTDTVWIAAAWTHGMGNQRAWWSSQPGMDMERTAQLVLTKSTDDGQTWSAPINITSQVKDPSWRFLLQGPGRGIAMHDGTLVFPIQFIDSAGVPSAGMMYSRDARRELAHPQSWPAATPPRRRWSSWRRGCSCSTCATTGAAAGRWPSPRDLGRTWTEHESSRRASARAGVHGQPHSGRGPATMCWGAICCSSPTPTRRRGAITYHGQGQPRRWGDLAPREPAAARRGGGVGLLPA